MKEAHPYEEVAYDIYLLENTQEDVGSGLIGELPEAISEEDLLKLLKHAFGLSSNKTYAFSAKKFQK